MYRNLPQPLKFTMLDIAIGKCAKIAAANRDTADALTMYKTLMNECMNWLQSDEAQDNRNEAKTVMTIREAAKAEYAIIQTAIA